MAKAPGLNTWLHRTTKQYLVQVSSGDMERRFAPLVFHDAQGEPVSNAEWIHAPDVSAVTGFATKYWIITGDVVTLMSQAQRDAVDAAELSAQFDAIANELTNTKDRDRAIILALLDVANFLSNQVESIKTAATGSANHGAFSTAVSGIPASPQRTIGELITLVRNKLGS